MNVVRSVVEMVLGDVKTEASRKAVPLDEFSSIKVTMDVCTQAVTDAKRKAQSKVVEMIVPKKAVSQAAPA